MKDNTWYTYKNIHDKEWLGESASEIVNINK